MNAGRPQPGHGQGNPTPTSRTIGLSLNDLAVPATPHTSHTVNTPTGSYQSYHANVYTPTHRQLQQQQLASQTMHTSAIPVDVNSSQYLAELRKLLIKSKGTAYEQTLQKFIDLKNAEIADTFNRPQTPSSRSPSPTHKYQLQQQQQQYQQQQQLNRPVSPASTRHSVSNSSKTAGQGQIPANKEFGSAFHIQTPRGRSLSPAVTNRQPTSGAPSVTQMYGGQPSSVSHARFFSDEDAGNISNRGAGGGGNGVDNTKYSNYISSTSTGVNIPTTQSELDLDFSNLGTPRQRLDISGLESIKFDDPNDTLRNNLPNKDRQKWLDFMSQPLERNSWKVRPPPVSLIYV
jgi:hypothetical protein